MAKVDVYEMVTQRMIALLEAGTVPWVKPWAVNPGCGAFPSNLTTGRPYRGVNTLILWCEQQAFGYSSPYWMTFNQAKAKGWKVRKGEKATSIIFWKFLDVSETDETGERSDRQIPVLRYYNVFNADQVEGAVIPGSGEFEQPEPIEEAQRIADGFAPPRGPRVTHLPMDRACYSPSRDVIQMPPRGAFRDMEAYYATLFHEQVHSTGHASRLDRKFGARKGDADYAREELVAEIGAGFLCASAGLGFSGDSGAPWDGMPHAAYIAHWLGRLENDKRLVVTAAGQAQKAADLILGGADATEGDPSAPEEQGRTTHPALAA